MNKQLQETWAVLTADKKKATALGALALLSGGLWIRAAVMSGPSQAAASTHETTTDTTNKHSSSAGASAAAGGVNPETFPAITLEAVGDLNRDLFALSDALLASSAQMEQAGSDRPKSARRNDDKSLRTATTRAQTVEERVRDEAQGLHLRSTMIGANPIAVIEVAGATGRSSPVLRLGDHVAGFVLRVVRAQEVELEKEGVRVTLSRTTDGQQ